MIIMSKPNKLEERVGKLEKRVSILETQLGERTVDIPASNEKSKKTSIKEFLLEKNSLGDVQKTLAIAYYLEAFEGMTSFNADDLKKGFRQAKERLPKNINDKVNMNIKKGHIMNQEEKKDGKKAWEITSSGELFVKNDFKDEK